MRALLYLGGLAAVVTGLVVVDRSPADVANQVTLLVLLAGAGSLGFAAPRWAWLSGLATGGCLAAAHAVYLLTGIGLPYPMSPRGWAGPGTLLVLVVPALAAAYLGAGFGALLRPHPAAS